MSERAWFLVFTAICAILSGCITDEPSEADLLRNAYFATLREDPHLSIRSQDATMLVWGQPAPHLVIDVSYEGDTLANQEVWDRLTQFLKEHTDKKTITYGEPKQIEVDPAISSGGYTRTEAYNLHSLHFENSDKVTSFDGTIYRHILILDGRGVGEDDEPGFSGLYSKPGRITIMIPEIEQDPYTQLQRLVFADEDRWTESNVAVLLHEFGHGMGLVAHGAPMLHDRLLPGEDESCQCHSKYEDSLMHPTVTRCEPLVPEVGVVCMRVVNNDLDSYDLADLAALRDIGRNFAEQNNRI